MSTQTYIVFCGGIGFPTKGVSTIDVFQQLAEYQCKTLRREGTWKIIHEGSKLIAKHDDGTIVKVVPEKEPIRRSVWSQDDAEEAKVSKY